ncbi:hypothetical protein D9M70_597730 [compost metagenome]
MEGCPLHLISEGQSVACNLDDVERSTFVKTSAVASAVHQGIGEIGLIQIRNHGFKQFTAGHPAVNDDDRNLATPDQAHTGSGRAYMRHGRTLKIEIE